MTVEFLKWENEYNTGESKIDEQHQKIFMYINRLHVALKAQKGDEEIDEIMKGLIEYSEYHFKLEEQMMQKSGYPKYEVHKNEHQIFIDRMAMLTEEMKNRHRSISIRLLKFLKVWFSGHILNIDKKFVQHITPGESPNEPV